MRQPWPRHPLVLELNARVWVRELSARAGRRITLATVPDQDIDALARLGFDAVWLMGVWTTGPGAIAVARSHGALRDRYSRALPDWSVADVAGSPFAVSRYEVSGELGGPGALASLRARLGHRGMRLILDFVPNHTARDHPLLTQRPEAFVQGFEEDLTRDPASFFRTRSGCIVAHGRDPNYPAWTDTAQINYGQLAGRESMLATLAKIADRCDGVRCDMAMLALPEVMERTWGTRLGRDWIRAGFWSGAIQAIRARHPGFLFLAEGYWGLEWRLQREGFRFTYDKTLYDRLLRGDHSGVRGHLWGEEAFQEGCARFLENHDEERAMSAFAPDRWQSAAVATFLAPGLRLFHQGQVDGRALQVPVQLTRWPTEPARPEVRSFHERLLGILRAPLLRDGACRQLEVRPAGPDGGEWGSLLALAWRPAGDPRATPGFLAVVNLGGERAWGRVPLPEGSVGPEDRYVLLDRWDDEAYFRSGRELIHPGLFVALGAHRSHLFEVARVE